MVDPSPAERPIPRSYLSRWRFSDWTLGLLVALTVLAAWEGYTLNNRPESRGCGGDFRPFYTAGEMVSHGEAKRLYDQPYFRHAEKSLRDDPLGLLLYPPTLGLFVAPLGRLSYEKALVAWWAIQAICLLATGAIFYHTTPLPQPWRINMLVALAALVPLWIAVTIGHLSPMLLLALAGGLTLHKQGKHGWAGLVLSLLALKPQLAAGLLLWMLLRRDLRTLLGLGAGFAIQALAVVVLLGPRLWLDYPQALPTISAIIRACRASPLFEQSFAGIARNLFGRTGLTVWQTVAVRITYAVTTGAAVVMLCRVAWTRRPWQSLSEKLPSPSGREAGGEGGLQQAAAKNGHSGLIIPHPDPLRAPTEGWSGTGDQNYEYACGVLFMMIFPPYFLVYDQTLLAVPLVMLWASPAWRWGVALWATTTGLAAYLSFALGFSLTGLVALATMFALARTVPKTAT